MSTSWTTGLSLIVAFAAAGAGLGAAIDFWLGKGGQKRVRDWLEDKWLVLSDVRFNNFGRREAAFAVRVIDSIFGRFFSLRRFYIVLFLFFVGMFFTTGIPIIRHGADLGLQHYDFVLVGGCIALSVTLFSITVSLTRLVASLTEAHLPQKYFYSLIYFFILLAAQYAVALTSEALMEFSLSIVAAFSALRVVEVEYDLLERIWDSLTRIVRTAIENWSWWPYSQRDGFLGFEMEMDPFSAANAYARLLSAFANVSRLLLAFLFLGSFALRPFQGFVMTLWARVVESDKPVFTLVLGGLAAFGKTIQELVKALT